MPSLLISPRFGTLEGKLEGSNGNVIWKARGDAEEKKVETWRKEKRTDGGSIRERDGKLSARIQYFGADGKRHDKERPARNRTHARELIKQMRAELKNHGQLTLDSDRMTFAELSEIYKKQRLVPAVIVDGRKVAGLRSHYSLRGSLIPVVAHFGRKHIRSIAHSDLEEYKLIRLRTPVVIKGSSRRIERTAQ